MSEGEKPNNVRDIRIEKVFYEDALDCYVANFEVYEDDKLKSIGVQACGDAKDELEAWRYAIKWVSSRDLESNNVSIVSLSAGNGKSKPSIIFLSANATR